MPKYLIRVKGAFIEPTLYDTNDLSTIRGGGLTLLYIHKKVEKVLGNKAKRFYKGASQCAYIFESDDGGEVIKNRLIAAFKENDTIPFKHIIPVISVQEITGSYVKALEKAETESASLIYQNWTVSPLQFIENAKSYDAENHTFPALAGELSKSVASRQKYGREQKQSFYKEALGERAKDINFAHDFQQLIDFNTIDKTIEFKKELPLSLHNKIAVFYADGNGFGKVFKEAREKGDFSFKLSSLRAEKLREKLLKNIMDWLVERAKSNQWKAYAYHKEGNKIDLRFETILWGGDECAFVMPAWLAVEFTEKFFEWTKGWCLNGKPLTNACGIAIAHVKVPIRQMRKIAKTVADAAKDAKDAGLRDKNSVTFEIYESLHPPDEDFIAFRNKSYSADKDISQHLAFDGDRFQEMIEAMKAIKDEDSGFPRSQIYKAMRAEDAEKSVKDYIERVPDKNRAELELPCFDERPFNLKLALITTLWDYVAPFKKGEAS